MKRIYIIAVATVVLFVAGLSGSRLFSEKDAEARKSSVNSGISITDGSSPCDTEVAVRQQPKAAIVDAHPKGASNKALPSKQEVDRYSRIPDGESVKGSFRKGQADSLAVAGGAISFSGGTLLRDTELSVSVLSGDDMPELDFAMTNVTAQGEGYRFLPHGTHFSNEGATVRLGYDRTKIPSGYTEDDIRTFYYDIREGHWVALDRIAVNKELAFVESKTTHFTDMINGVIQAPESPETEGFAPTMMNDIKAADPTAKLNIISPPSANNRGSANLQYPLEMPPARNGMAPSLTIGYNSDGGNGWLGQGWDISIPSVTVDTRWGVPRYDMTNESETYSLSGSMLSTMDDKGAMSVAHRGDRIPRKTDRQFYTRQGGDFSRIIRKGNSPETYTWEVTDRQGVVYTYGGEGAVLKGTITDITGRTREVVAEWKLKRVVETHGDWIEYEYATADEAVRGGLVAKAIYLAKISAGNSGSTEPHTVVTFSGDRIKRQKANNARYGFLSSSNRLLESVQVDFMGERLRGWSFSYVDGAFHKDLLESIRQNDDGGNEVSFQTFAYYDDVMSDKGYIPFKAQSETWNTHNDRLDAGFINPLQFISDRFSDKPTALGGTASSSVGGSFYAGIGADDQSPSTSGTVGGSFSYSYDRSRGLSTFVDLNGDGLPDKVYCVGSAVYYRPQSRNLDTGEVSYGDPIRVRGISGFSFTSSNTFSGGPDIKAGWGWGAATVGIDWAKTITKTKEYFSDINGDGLIDLVSNGTVYFNHIEFDASGNAVPTFTLSSGDTPSPIIYDPSKIDRSVSAVDPEEQAELLRTSPMVDAVRIWVAPRAGTVNISGTVSLLPPSGDYDVNDYAKADGVRVAIQKGASELWSRNIAKGDATEYTAAPQSVAVKKGDCIYFRIQCGSEEMSNGAFDEVAWNPVITYDGTEEIMPDGYSSVKYQPGEGALYFAAKSVGVDKGNQTVGLSGNLTKPLTTDDITLTVIGFTDRKDANGNDNPAYKEKTVYEKVIPWNETFDGELTYTIDNSEGFTNFRCAVNSESNVRWDRIKWVPVIDYNDSTGTAQSASMFPDCMIYSNHAKTGMSYTPAAADTVMTVRPAIAFLSPGYNGSLTLTVKTADRLLGKRTFAVTGGVVGNDSLTVRMSPTEKEAIWFEYFSDNPLAGETVMTASVSVKTPSLTAPQTVDANLYTVNGAYAFGHLYRGWGGFAYNASDKRYARPIDESLLSLPEDKDAKMDPLTMAFTPMSPDLNRLDRWQGQREDIFITAARMGAARLTEQNVVLVNPLENLGELPGLSGEHLQGTGAFAVDHKSETNSKVTQAGLIITLNDAEGTYKVKSMMMDMNGDGYPDIVEGGRIQYTNPLGGLSGEVYGGIGTTVGESRSQAYALGSDPIVGIISSLTTKDKAHNSGTGASNKAKASINGSLGYTPTNEDRSTESFVDVNGDGLPDKIVSNNKVRINLGYTFTDPVDWEIDRIQEGKGTSFTASMGGGVEKGFNRGSGSFAGGFNLVTSTNAEQCNLIDINSDGLPDKVWILKDNIMVALNTGAGFDSPFVWKGVSALNETASTAEGGNIAFTVNITPKAIPIKLSFNLGTSMSHSISRTNYSLQDVDGDGYLDILESDRENELRVTRSAIGRTNMLRSVTNSLGGRFELDYVRSVPTYGLPGGKWVMSALTVDDGIHDDGPLMKSVFEYSDGFRDRHEREFLGFGKVVTKSLDTENGDAVYRRAVQEFAVDNYYTSGNLLASYLTDASGNKFTETVNEYDAYSVTANADSYSFVPRDVIYSDRAAAFVPLRYTANRQYEGAPQGLVISEAWNEYYLNGHHGELKSYRYSDKGSLGSDGSGSYDYATGISYTSNAEKNILGLPTSVTVTGGDGTLYHSVSATYDTKYPNHLTQVSQQLGNGTAVTDYRYDRYGNITQKTMPANGTGQRMWYKYRYEPVMNMYVERIDDAWGYRSEAGNFDYRYGIALERRDLNNFYYETEIDNLGRVTKVRGPNELATGVDYIIAFEYHPAAKFGTSGITAPAYAVTKHYDILHPGDDLETVTFVDGFGRAVQVKKDGVVTTASKGSGASDQNVMIVSGRNVYDAFGRVAKAYYPTTEGIGGKTVFNTAFDNVSPTVTVYDVLDRALSVKLPDGSETTTAYTLDSGENTLVTKVTDALGNSQSTLTNGSGKTVRSVQYSGPDGEISTRFEYDGIQRLVRVTDTEGNVTTSVYDMGDRRTQVNHPASGITSFTYDPLGNVLTKQTANMAEEGKMITYSYDYHRLTGISYPDHPENNVRYHYGGRNASYNRIGRLMLREDGSGAIEYFYGKMGEVTKTRRTLIVPNQAIATYVTQWTYDSHNRLLEMIYPDEERVTYSYNLGGLLEKVRGEKSYGYDYITKLGYDKFEQRSYMRYCNGAETFYTYDDRRRLSNLAVSCGNTAIMNNAYTFDAVSNVLSVANNAPLPQSGKAGGRMNHAYTYDGLYRLASATGTYSGADSRSASYTLAMGYDNMHRITSKRQHLTQQNVQFDGSLNVGYDLSYSYGTEEGKKFQLGSVRDINYRTEISPEGQQTENGHVYTYDRNGNLVYVNTSRVMRDGRENTGIGERRLIWDEENRLLAVDDNGFVSNYWYDADGERTVKTSGESDQVFVNGVFSGGFTNTAKFSLYVSPYLVANQGGRYTKHIYAGSQRIVSKVGDFASYGSDPRRIEYAGANTDGLKVDYKSKYVAQQQTIRNNYAFFEVPYNGVDNDNYADGEGFCCNDGSMEAARRAPSRAVTRSFKDPDSYENLQFFYHPDHLGSSSFITNHEGEVVQHIEYVPFGEVFIEERNNVWNTPYLFNAKEFDEDTGMYYYGARYYDPRLSLWMSTDIEQEKNHSNTTYGYTPNPLKYIDPLGTDTLNISFSNNRWKFEKPIMAKGDDVFNVTIDNKTETYIFSDGEYGKRVNCLNLYIGEKKSDYTFGIYHVSGEQENGTGYFVTPGGDSSTSNGSGRRIPEGTYPIDAPTSGVAWRKPGVGGIVSNRGIRFHYGRGNARKWTEGCFVISSAYTLSDGTIQYDLNASKTASQNFDKILGASSHFDYPINRGGRQTIRNGSVFPKSISHQLILQSRPK